MTHLSALRQASQATSKALEVILKRAKTKSLDDACALFQQISFVRVHGKLGGYPELKYSAGVSSENVVLAAGQVLVVSEVEDPLPTFDEASTLQQSADRIYFIGFGFHPDNVRRLRLFDTVADNPQHISGTTLGFSEKEWKGAMETTLRSQWTPGQAVSANAYNFLRHRAELD